jgi:predicted deacylase
MNTDSVRIGDVEARSGEKKTGYLSVGETPVANVSIPIAIINGIKPGPTLCISGGVHGCEYSSIEAVIRVVTEADPETLNGTLLAVPVVNMAGFETRGPQGGISTPFQCPLDGINLNRIFPGNPDGTMSYQIAATFVDKVISKADYYIDCHGGDLNEELLPLVIVSSGDDEPSKITKKVLAPSFDCDFIIEEHLTGASLAAALALGKPALTVEAGGYGRVMEDAVKLMVNGVTDVMRRIGMKEGEPRPARKQIVRKGWWSVYVKRGGVCYSAALGTKVKKGERIGEVRNVFGDVLERLDSPINGLVIFRRSTLPVSTNDRVLGILPDDDLPPPKPRPYP